MSRLAASVLFLAATASLGQAPVAPPSPAALAPAPRPTVVVLDDRMVRDQAPPPFLDRVSDQVGKLRGMSVVRFSEARKRLGPKADRALSGCGDDEGCLAAAARGVGADLVVTVRLTRREGAFFLAITRINSLRPQFADDTGTLAGTELDALAGVPEAVSELFSDAEAR